MAAQNNLDEQVKKHFANIASESLKIGAQRDVKRLIKEASISYDEVVQAKTFESESESEKFKNIINKIKNIEEKIIEPAISLFLKKGKELRERDNIQDEVSAVEIVKFSLQLGTDIQKLFNLIDEACANELQKNSEWSQSLRIVVKNSGATISDKLLSDKIKGQGLSDDVNKALDDIFELRKTSRGLSVYINGNIDAIETLQKQTQQKKIYEAIDQHYEHFKSFTEQNLFSFTLTKKKLNEIFSEIKLKGSKSSTSVWDWFKSPERKDGHGGYDLLVNNFGQFVQTLIDMHEHITETFEFIQYLNNTFSFHGQKTMNINYGHIAEAYEHHLEEHHGFNPGEYTISLAKEQSYPDEPEKDDETQYYAWIRHLAQASGTWAGYLGPDTPFSQVKQIFREDRSLKYLNRKYFINARKELSNILFKVNKILNDKDNDKKNSAQIVDFLNQKRAAAKVDDASIKSSAEILAQQANKELFDRQ